MLESILIKNYKKIDTKFISLSKINIIIGENNSGKSTILEAINDILKINSDQKLSNFSIDEKNPTYFKLKLNSKDFEFSFDKKGSLKKEYLKTFEDFKIELNNEPIYIKNGENNPFDIYKSILTNIFLNKLKNEKNLSESVTTILESLKTINLELLKNISVSDLMAFDDMKKNKEIIEKNYQNSNILFDPIKGISLKEDIKSVKDYDKVLNMGSGYKRNICFQMLLSNKTKNKVCMIDEIENSMSPAKTEKILDLLFEKNEQIFLTTHNPHVAFYSEEQFKSQSKIIELYDANNDQNIEGQIKDRLVFYSKLKNEINFKNLEILMFVEGTNDISIFKKLIPERFKNKLFIFSSYGAKNMTKLTEDFEKSFGLDFMTNKIILKIIDGDQKRDSKEKFENKEKPYKQIVYFLEQPSLEFYANKETLIKEKMIKNEILYDNQLLAKTDLNVEFSSTDKIFNKQDKKRINDEILYNELSQNSNHSLRNEINQLFNSLEK